MSTEQRKDINTKKMIAREIKLDNMTSDEKESFKNKDTKDHFQKWTSYRQEEEQDFKNESDDPFSFQYNERKRNREQKFKILIDDYFQNYNGEKPSDDMLQHFEQDVRIAHLLFHQQTGFDNVPHLDNVNLTQEEVNDIEKIY